jgi:hypothetical protein
MFFGAGVKVDASSAILGIRVAKGFRGDSFL